VYFICIPESTLTLVSAADEHASPPGTLYWGRQKDRCEEKIPIPSLDSIFGSPTGKMMMALEVSPTLSLTATAESLHKF
jgi:hypothetical protein